MKTLNAILVVIITAMLAVVGCKKSNSNTGATNVSPLSIIRKAFPNPAPDVSPSINKIAFGMRYGDFNAALAELDKLAANPSLTSDQKKAVADAIEAVKKSQAAAAAPKQ
jgi:hypothetical protein